MSELRINNITDRTGDSGPVFAGVSTVSSTSAFTVPVGPTEMRGGRGRAIFCGGYTPSVVNTIDTVEISTAGNGSDFGDLSRTTTDTGGFASATRGFAVGGYNPANSPIQQEDMDYVIFSSGGGGNDFGNLESPTWGVSCCANSTRGILAGGRSSDTTYNGGYLTGISYIEMASQGQDASDFGELVEDKRAGTTVNALTSAGFASPTRGVIAGGGNPRTNVIQYVTIATKGNAVDFGKLADEAALGRNTGFSSPTRGISAGGLIPSAVNIIQYVTIATTGDATDFGDLTVVRYTAGSGASSTRGVIGGGSNPSAKQNVIDYVTIASTGNATDFGDLTQARMNVGSSDAHGGLG